MPGSAKRCFFPPSHFERKDEKLEREQRAKEICVSCPVRQPCLDYAIKIREPHGIWGGLNEVERKQLLAHRGRSQPNQHWISLPQTQSKGEANAAATAIRLL